MSNTHEILLAASEGQRALKAWMDAHPSEVTVALATELRKEGDALGAAGQLEPSGFRRMAAAQVYWRVDDPANALDQTLQYLGTVFCLVDDVPTYMSVRDEVLSAGATAKTRGLDALALAAGLLGADCAYMASESSSEPATKNSYLLTAFRDLVGATAGLKSKPPISDGGASAERLASLSLAVYVRSSKTDWPNDRTEVDALTTALASATERLVPVDYQSFDGVQKTNFLAHHLANLSSEYGNPNIASKRRVFLAGNV